MVKKEKLKLWNLSLPEHNKQQETHHWVLEMMLFVFVHHTEVVNKRKQKETAMEP